MIRQFVLTMLTAAVLIMPLQFVFAANSTVKAIDDVAVRYLYVQPGQTLHNIVVRIYAHRKSEWPKLSNDIVRMNPHAFVNNDATQMKAGVRLELPQREKAKKIVKLNTGLKHVGDVVLSRGRALAVNRESASRKLNAGDHVFVGDKLITGEDGFLRIQMIDDAILDLRCYSIMVIEDYVISKSKIGSRSVLNLLQGSLKKVTGEIGKWKDDVYQLNTPVASIGVRGTEYALRVFQSKGCDGTIDLDDDGLYLKVAKGLIDVKNKSGSTTVQKGDTLYIPLPGAPPVAKTISEGVLEPEVEPSEETSNVWWYVFGIALLGFAL